MTSYEPLTSPESVESGEKEIVPLFTFLRVDRWPLKTRKEPGNFSY